ncbi:class I SAM-dependent methyltransferase [Priestia abyssalis]|uniref:class I SAM-dependent methyltransferase n=1 Tax=Priestia abyssalis TaxID=1221450 RepID=UPI000994B2FB|nr:class I SAM-dependent methyltransferase [Priestia abyssalis]
MNNQWNQAIYGCWAPFYDFFFNKGIFYRARKRVFQEVQWKKGQKVLFVGIGTGADLGFIPYADLEVTAIDYSEEMLQKAEEKYVNSSIHFRQMNAQMLDFESGSFDVIVASLVLSVVPDPVKVMKEMVRVAKDEGEILIFDKFAPANERLSFGKKLIRPVIKMLGTDIGLSFDRVYQNVNHHCRIQYNLDVMMKGMYRKIKLQKIR